MQKNRILVVGIFVVDLSFYSEKLPAPGETVIGRNYIIGPGGKGSNQCVAISRSGGEVSLIARIGNDDFGKMGIELYNKERISLEGLIISENDKTGSATIAIDNNGMNSIIVVPGASAGLTENMIDQKLNLFKNSSICLTGFELPLEVTKHTLNIAKSNQLKTILNPAPYFDVDKDTYKLVDYLTPNEHEASSLTGVKIKTYNDARVAGRKICELGVGTSIITLGEKGVLCTRGIDDYQGLYIPALKQNEKVIDTVGAGDVFNGAFATAISNGIGTEDALFFANKAASISVTKPGAALSSPYKDEINKH